MNVTKETTLNHYDPHKKIMCPECGHDIIVIINRENFKCNECQHTFSLAEAYGEKRESVLGEFVNYGFSIKEPDDHILELYHRDKRIAQFNQSAVTPEIIQTGCRNYLASISR